MTITTDETTSRARFDYDHVVIQKDDDFISIADGLSPSFMRDTEDFNAPVVTSSVDVLSADPGFMIVPVTLAAKTGLLTEDACDRLGIPCKVVPDLDARAPFDEDDEDAS